MLSMASIKDGKPITRFGINFFAYGYSQFVTLAIQFLQVPLFLHAWGSAKYGEWLVITGIPTMMAIVDLGINQASANRGTMAASSGDWDSAKTALHTAQAFTTTISILLISVTYLLAKLINWDTLLKLNQISNTETAVILIAMTIGLCAQLHGGVLDAYYRINDKAALGAFLLANRRTADLIVSFIVIYTGGSLINLAIYLCITQWMLVLAIGITGVYVTKKNIFGYTHTTKHELKKIVSPGMGYMAIPLSQVITLQGSVQILNQITGPTNVVIFTMVRTLVRIIIQFAVVANNALRPELARLAGKKMFSELNSLSNRISKWACIISSIGFLLLIALGQKIINFWGNHSISIEKWQICVIGTHALLNVFWYVKSAAKIATNTHERLGWTYCIASIVSLALWLSIKNYINPILGASLLLAFPEVILVANSLRKSKSLSDESLG